MKTKPITISGYTSGLKIRSKESGESSRIIEGYSIVFNSESEVLWRDGGKDCVEVISPDAISRELLDQSDIKMTVNHDFNQLLARSKRGAGTLTYDIDEHGVSFAFEAPNTERGNEILEMIRRGDLDGCSFMFQADYGSNEAVKVEDRGDKIIYTVKKIDAIYDFTLTPSPAYPETECSARALAAKALGEDSEEHLDDLEAMRAEISKVDELLKTE